jgi:hypothetical protein
MSKPDAAELIAGVALATLTLFLALAGRKDLVAQAGGSYTVPNTSPGAPAGATTTVTVEAGTVIPRNQAEAAAAGNVVSKEVKRSWLGGLVVGVDNRVSTSKSIAFAWTIAVTFGLLSLVVAIWLGDHEPWDLQVKRGLQEEYLLLLGGPYAAAILAKYATSNQADTKTTGAVGGAAPAQLVTNDSGDTDLGDFQYVLFNAIGLMFFFGDFIGDLDKGFPDLPPILTGLMLTSTGGYAAKKLLQQAAPTLISVVPGSQAPGQTVQVFGTNLDLPGSAADSEQPLTPTVLVGTKPATVSAHALVLGNDCLTVTVPGDATIGSAPISVARADGVQAKDSRGVAVLPFEVLAPPP